jgi:hypothetical protein
MASPLILLATLSLATLALAGCTSDDNKTLDQLRAAYDDQPFRGGQATPMHTWLQTSPDTLLFLHWNHEDPLKATGLWFVGDGFRARGCVGVGGISQAQIADGYVHFHKESSPNWDQAHHSSDRNVMGWWLRHVGVEDGIQPGPGAPISEEGKVYPLMPSYESAPAC